jgi:ATP-binding cassette subfamily B protein
MMGGPGGPRQILERETSRPQNVSATLRRFATYFRAYWASLLIVAVLVIVGTWAQVTAPELIGQAVDCYLVPGAAATLEGAAANLASDQTPASDSNCWYATVEPGRTTEQTIQGLAGLVLLTVGLYVLGAVTGGLQFYVMSWAGNHALRNMRIDLFKQIHRLSLNYYAENEAGNVMSRITNDTDTIQQAFGFALVNVTSGILLILWIVYKMLALNWVYALVSLAVLPVMIVATLWISSQARKAFRRSRREIGNVNADLQQSIANVREVQAFSREDENIDNFRVVNAANRDANIRAVSYTSALAPVLEALGYVSIAIVTGVGGLALLRGNELGGAVVSLGLIVAFLGYVQRFNQPIQQVSVLWTNIQSAIAGGERIFGLLDIKPEIEDKPAAQPMPSIQGHVVFDQVDAAYKKGIPVLKEVSLEAKPGQTIAIVGPTGAGKTTIINLIPRFYDVTGGRITIDGRDVRDVTAASLRQQIGIVLQDTFLFSDTVLNNIRYGKPEATDEEVMAAAKLVQADQVIERLSEGYQTVLGERGTGLSQGQRQLLAIARAALSDPRILILDEATSSVDTRTERQIQRALEKLLHGRTSFVIAHRLSTIRNADLVLMLQDGQIVERGTHDELLAQRGAYYDLYMSQFRRVEAVAETTPMQETGRNGQQVAPAPA